MYWSLVLVAYCVVGRRDQSCGREGVYVCVCRVITGMPVWPIFVASDVWNVRYA